MTDGVPMTDWKCPRCDWANRGFATQCLSCGLPREEAPGAHVAPKSWDLAPPRNPSGPALSMAEPLSHLPPPAPVDRWNTEGLGRGLLFAAGAAIIATAIWYLVTALSGYELGIVAIAVGWVVGTAAVLGARGRSSLMLVAGSVIFTLIALVYGEYLIIYHYLTQMVGPLDLLQPPWVVIPIVIEILVEDPITLLFWGIAIYSAASVPFKAIGQPAQPTAAPEPAAQPLAASPDGQVSPQG